MSSMSELRNYKAAEKSLSDRLDFLKTKTAARHTDWATCYDERGDYVNGINHEVADKKFAAWNLAISREMQTDQALANIRAIIKEMEGM